MQIEAMRLKETEIKCIENLFVKVFGHGELYLFGSRVDDSKRGGDIDLYIVPESKDNLSARKIDFLVLLKRAIDEQKIDVVIDRGNDRLIDRVAKTTGVLLCRY
jgi:predicted nucleotidyltransferase